MSQFDLDEFEAEVHALLAAYRRLQADYASIKAAYDVETARTREIRKRLDEVIKHIRELEY